ncbi:hypothetical protein AYI69_g3818 [Smittium culicis]|uniref:Uncharacterized protein n=1 Tax=Smittium culicis TaxID=133412 RepID=A0A1R1YIL9_9FUNG|nr:hypothetical protein AYI69_g3818 [Smittium culicis]
MEQQLLDKISELNDNINLLMTKLNSDEEDIEDNYITAHSQMCDLQTYPRLIESLPSLDEDFFRAPLSEEKKREIIHSCPRTLGMKYSPPPLNDEAPYGIKKMDTSYYNIQSFLAQATKQVDFYVHQLVQLDEVPSDNPRIMFASKMRMLLTEAGTMITQTRLENLQQGLNLPGRAFQVNPTCNEPLMDQSKLSELIASKKATKTSPSRPFRMLQKLGSAQPATAYSSQVTTEPNHQTENAKSSFTKYSNSNQGFRGSIGRGRVRGKSHVRMQDDTVERHPYFNRPIGCIPEYNDKPSVQEIFEVSMTSDKVGQITRYQNDGLFIRSPHYGLVEIQLRNGHKTSVDQDSGFKLCNKISQIQSEPVADNSTFRYANKHQTYDLEGYTKQNQRPPERSHIDFEKRASYYKEPCFIHWEGTCHVGGNPARSPEFEKDPRAEDKSLGFVERLVGNCPTDGPYSRNGILHRFQRHQVGDSCGIPSIFGITARAPEELEHQCKRAVENFIRSKAPERFWEFGSRLLQKYHNYCIREVWSERHRLICDSTKQKVLPILQLVQRYGSCGNQFFSSLMDQLDDSLQFPTIQHDPSSYPENQTREGNNDNHNAQLAIGNLVPRCYQRINSESNHPTGLSSYTRPEKRQIPTFQEQIMELDGLEDKRGSLFSQGLAIKAIEIILNNPRITKRLRKYHPAQKMFLSWIQSEKISRKINAADLINFLAKLFVDDKLSVSIIKSYRSAILNICEHSKEISSQPCFITFFKALQEPSIVSFIRPKFNISPVIKQLRPWGPTRNLGTKELAAKFFWLLSIREFLRSTDLHRVDDVQTLVLEDYIRLAIISPKKKRKGRPICKHNEIKSHTDKILCPVETYKEYKKRIGDVECLKEHTNHPEIKLSMLLRHIGDFSRALNTDSITRYINSLTDLMDLPPGNTRPKTRALGHTMAAAAGVPPSEIVSQAFWSNYYMFDTYYCLSRSSSSNLTESVLPLEPHNMIP